jgi:transcription elongation factor GreA
MLNDIRVAGLGSWVKIREYGSDEEEVYRIATETNVSENAIGANTRMGQTLLGAKPGDDVTLEGPSGGLKFSVLDVRRAQ